MRQDVAAAAGAQKKCASSQSAPLPVPYPPGAADRPAAVSHTARHIALHGGTIMTMGYRRWLGLGALAIGAALTSPPASQASSHREAPGIADDPAADSTDLHVFRSPTA